MIIIKTGYYPDSYHQKILYTSNGWIKVAHKIKGRWLVFEKDLDLPTTRRYFLNKFIEIIEV